MKIYCFLFYTQLRYLLHCILTHRAHSTLLATKLATNIALNLENFLNNHPKEILVRRAKVNNLENIDISIPLNKVVGIDEVLRYNKLENICN